MAGIVLVGECYPYRNIDKGNPFNNSQGRLLATCVGLTLDQLQLLVDCHYVVSKYYPSHMRNTNAFEWLLGKQWQRLEEEYRERYSTIILIGKRLARVVLGADSDFFTFHQHHCFQVATIPNPLAELWWNKELHLKATEQFLTKLLKEQT